MDEKELEELESLEREALEELEDKGELDEGIEQEQTIEQDTGEPEKDETKDDTGDSGDGHEDKSSSGEEESEVDGDLEDKKENESEKESKDESEDKFTPIEIEVGGHKLTIDSQEDLVEFAKKGAESYNTKGDTFKSEREIIEQGKISTDELRLLIDAKNGSKEAIAKLAKSGNVDILDVTSDMADKYNPQFQPQEQSDVDIVASEILSDREHAKEFQDISRNLPEDFINAISTNGEALRNFSSHIKSGLAQKVIPKAIAENIKSGGSFVDHYVKIGMEMSNNDAKNEDKKPERELGEREKSLRNKASTKSTSDVPSKDSSGDDIWDLTDEEFAEKYGE